MQQQRLMRSRTEVVISGVCGGLGEYFGVDPVIVRMIFALVTLTTGLGLFIYPALWIAMPKAPAPMGGLDGTQMFGANEQPYVVQRERAGVATSARYAEPPPPNSYNFDPLTGEPIRPSGAAGETTRLPYDPFPTDPQQISYQQTATPSNKGRWVAFGLIAFGFVVLADQLHINIEFIFPLLMIGLGIYLLRKR